MTLNKVMMIGDKILNHTKLQLKILELLKENGPMTRDQITIEVFSEFRVKKTGGLRFRTTIYDALKPMVIAGEVIKYPLHTDERVRGRPKVVFALAGDGD